MKIVRCSWFPPKGYAAISLVLWLIVKPNVTITPRFLNHEEIHERQQKEMLILLFFVWYALEFLIRFLFCWNRKKAYRSISFEREAYANESNLDYLTTRRHYSWLKYIKQ